MRKRGFDGFRILRVRGLVPVVSAGFFLLEAGDILLFETGPFFDLE